MCESGLRASSRHFVWWHLLQGCAHAYRADEQGVRNEEVQVERFLSINYLYT